MRKIYKYLVMIMLFVVLIPVGSKVAFGDTATTWNPNDKSPSIGLSNGNLTANNPSGADWHSVRSTTYKTTGKWYAENTVTTAATKQCMIGIGNSNSSLEGICDNNAAALFSWGRVCNSGGWLVDGSQYSFATGDTIGIALDCDAKSITFYKNGVLVYTYNYTFSGNIYLMAFCVDTGSTITTDFGGTTFKYAIPTGYQSWDVSSNQTTSVTGITLSKTTDILTVNQTDPLVATIQPSNATNPSVTWTSSDPTIVTVDANGKVTALKVGTVTITAISVDNPNIKATCTVTVTDPSQTVTTGNRCILEVTMINNTIKEYDLSIDEFNAFMTWYDLKSIGTGKSYFTITKHSNIKPFTARKETLSFDKIISFEEKDYIN